MWRVEVFFSFPKGAVGWELSVENTNSYLSFSFQIQDSPDTVAGRV